LITRVAIVATAAPKLHVMRGTQDEPVAVMDEESPAERP
jgi:hypothetical protein